LTRRSCAAFYPKARSKAITIPRPIPNCRDAFCLFYSDDSLHSPRVELSAAEIRRAVQLALAEDIGSGDVTTLATVPANATAKAAMRAREPLVVAGLAFAEAAFRQLSPKIKIKKLSRDGQRLVAGKIFLIISGPARAILSAERVALNFVQQLSGVATLTSQFVDAIEGTPAQILDTRKTTPGWRRFEKFAVACGGGRNHRIGLYDMVLIKDNHLAALRDAKPNAIAAAVQRAREKFPKLKVEVEADTLEQVSQAADTGADIILLDNMSLAQLRQAVKLVNRRAKTEASGGVNLKTVRAIAKTGVDFISVGALTHSARAVDIGLDF
jgi:nicotinate-nucleotide pyrophosphorylase (carboxylating)